MFRFTIRDVLWLTVVVALGAAWWVGRDRVWKGGERNRQLIEGLTSAGVKLELLPSSTSVTINFRPSPAITSLKKPTTSRGAMPFSGGTDYQAPPRLPLRISDQERP